jgi:hypothetical protein
MKTRRICFFTLLLSIGLCVCPTAAPAKLGETFAQITTRYGQPVKKLPDSRINDKAVEVYLYESGGRKIYVEFTDGKAANESARAPVDDPRFSHKTCLALATEVAGEPDWLVLRRNPDGGVVWIATNAVAILKRNSRNPDFLSVCTMSHATHLMRMEGLAASPNAVPSKSAAETKAAMAVRLLQWHQDLADKGSAYGEYHMGLRYRDGDGVPRDLEKAREFLKKAADQGDADAVKVLAKLSPGLKPGATGQIFTVRSADFGMGENVADVTSRVTELLRTRVDGFTADAKTLGADPLPGKRKRLVIRYDCNGTNFTLTVPGAKQVTYQALLKNTQK